MADVSVSRTIDAPADRLFEMVSHLERMGDWSPENTGGRWVDGDGPAVGAKFKGSNTNGNRKWSTVATVIAHEPGQRFAFDVVAGPFKVARWEYQFADAGDGRTEVTEHYTDQRGRFMHRLGGVASGVKDRFAHNRRTMEETLAALDAAATTG